MDYRVEDTMSNSDALKKFDQWAREQAEILFSAGMVQDKDEVYQMVKYASSFELDSSGQHSYYTLGPKWQQVMKAQIVAEQILIPKDQKFFPGHIASEKEKARRLRTEILGKVPSFLWDDCFEECLWFETNGPLSELCSRLSGPLNFTGIQYSDTESGDSGEEAWAIVGDGKFRLDFRLGYSQNRVLVYIYPMDSISHEDRIHFKDHLLSQIATTISVALRTTVFIGKSHFGENGQDEYNFHFDAFPFEILYVVSATNIKSES